MIYAVMRALAHLGGIALLSVASLSLAAPKHAQTLYDEPPKYPADFKHFDYVNPDAPKGGVLRRAGFGSFDSLNPFISKGVPAEDIGLIYDTLTTNSLDEPFSVYGLLAEKIEKADDCSWVRFYLRPQARFHDGQPVTAEDVKFTFDLLMSKGSPMYRGYYAEVERAEVEGPLTIKFIFTHPGNRELPLIVGQLPVLPKHWWETRDFSKGNLEIPLGSGPYKVANVEAGRSIRYERVKEWWGQNLPVSRGFYNFNTLQIDYYRDNTVALEAFKAGHFDFWQEISAKNWATAYNIPAVSKGELIKEEISNYNPVGMQGFIFNTRRPVFADRRVREAFTLLFDFEWTNRQLFNGAYTRTHSYFENSELGAEGLPSESELALLEPLRDQVPPKVFTDAYMPPASDGTGIIREQQRRAYQLLQEAGWRVDGDQMLDSNGAPVSFEFLLAQTEFERILLPYKRNLADLGIEMVIRRVDVSQYLNRLRSRDYDMIVGNFPQSSSPGNEQREYWHSSSADNPGSRNLIGLKDPAIDALVMSLIKADSRQSLIASTRALDRVLLWGYYVVPNWHIKTWRVAYWDKFEHPKVSPKYDIGLHTWWSRKTSKAAEAESAPTGSEQ